MGVLVRVKSIYWKLCFTVFLTLSVCAVGMNIWPRSSVGSSVFWLYRYQLWVRSLARTNICVVNLNVGSVSRCVLRFFFQIFVEFFTY